MTARYVPAIAKGFLEACEKGPLTGSPVERVRMTLLDGAEHSVDSSEMAFKAAGMGAMREAVLRASPQVMQPIMKVEVVVPEEYQVCVCVCVCVCMCVDCTHHTTA